jgi:hypothetical protein
MDAMMDKKCLFHWNQDEGGWHQPSLSSLNIAAMRSSRDSKDLFDDTRDRSQVSSVGGRFLGASAITSRAHGDGMTWLWQENECFSLSGM